MKKTKVAINGFGRIGRLLFRKLYGNRRFEIVAINDLSPVDNLLYLLKYDTVYGIFDKKIDKKILFLQESDPAKLPWKKLGVDLVVEATGIFETFEKAAVHLKAGAKKVVITAPAKDEEKPNAKTILIGINENEFKNCNITSNGSCTTNATHPIAAVINETLGIEKATLMTVHGYTATQSLVDSVTKSKDFRRGRAAAQNIIPSTTGASISVARVLTDLVGKFEGVAMRVPVLTGSILDLTFVTKKKTSVEQVNNILKKAAKDRRWKGILETTDEQIVSSDIIGQSCCSLVDLNYTKVVDGNLVKVLSWYDNEWGYIVTLVKHIEKFVS